MWKRLKSRNKSDSKASSSSITNSAEPTNKSPRISLPLSERTLVQHQNSERNAESEILSSQKSTRHQTQKPTDKKDDPLGLLVLHTPVERSVDILFIHGLGGTSLRTWCRDRDLENLWPQLWLPKETDLSTARILTFGYNAHFSSKKEQASLTIGDFANDLLFRMKYGESGPERLGQVPLIVVAHSMGGLVFKKAFIHGHTNEEFRSIISCIKAVLFLATPHRGTDLAQTLNKVLASSVFGHSPKDYVLELTRRSPTIDELNESFRHHASKLQIFSFYETLGTNVGPMTFMILEKQSALLGYPNETQQPLTANHHNVCKFTDTSDPNYISVLGALRSVVEDLQSFKKKEEVGGSTEDDLASITQLLGISGPPEDDIAACRSTRKTGTCQHFLQNEVFNDWVNNGSCPVLWVYAPPGSGKSTICSAAVDHLIAAGYHCAYFFFKYDNLQKRSIGHMLLSLAYQTALFLPEYRRALADLGRSGLRLDHYDALTIWKRVYVSILSRLNSEAIYWIIDGIDESESSKQIIEFMSTTGCFKCTLRILISSRPLPTITQFIQVANQKIPVHSLALSSSEGIRLFITDEIAFLPSDEGFKTETQNVILKRAQGNFLWASLILQRVLRCHRQDQVRKVLEETPIGMDELYNRMFSTVTGLALQEDKALSRILFSWAIYSKAPLTVDELTAAYFTEFETVLDIKHTVSQVCGQLVVVDTHDRISLVHYSARDYLERSALESISIDPETAHEDLLCKCLLTLCDESLRHKINSLKIPQFLPYATTSWTFHLENCSVKSDRALDALIKFFSGPFPLPWLQYLSMIGHLAELTVISRTLTVFARRRKDFEANRLLDPPRLSDLSLIENWAVDLLKLPAKFGNHLVEDPQMIYKCIPALSPVSSEFYQRFARAPSTTLSVSGLSNTRWDDCLARIFAKTGRPLRLAVSSLYIALAIEGITRSVMLWDTNLFAEFQILDIEQRADSLAFNSSGSLLACCEVSKTNIWKLGATFFLIRTVENPHQERALEFKFDKEDSLMMVTDLRRVYTLDTSANLSHWTRLDPNLMEEMSVPEGMFVGTPSSVSFNSDCTQIAVVYRAFSLSIWNIDPPKMIARLKQRPRQGKRTTTSYTGTSDVVWHPSDREVIGIHGEIIRWNPTDDTYKEVEGETGVVPNKIRCSPNGRVFITSDVEGTIKIYDVARMVLIYRLVSEDIINTICFGPSNVRFYDIRGSYCNVWEPDCLLQPPDAISERVGDPNGMNESILSNTENTRNTSTSFSTSGKITAVATCSEAEQHIAYANEDGIIKVFDPTSNSHHVIAQTIGLSIEVLEWNQSHDRLAFSIINGAITIKKITRRTAGQPLSVGDFYREKTPPTERGRVQQVLFDTSGKHLLVHGTKKSQILALPSGQVIAERKTTSLEGPTQWLQHPSQPNSLINISIRSVTIFTWQLQEERSIRIRFLDHLSPSFKLRAFQSYYSRLLLLRTEDLELFQPQYNYLLILPTTTIHNGDGQDSSTLIRPTLVPDTIAQHVRQPLGILPDGRLVFLDSKLWVCTYQLGGSVEVVIRHFFLPHEWVTRSDIELCQLLPDGSIICPSKGEVGIIQNEIISEW